MTKSKSSIDKQTLDQEELSIEQAIADGEYQSIRDLERANNEYQQIALDNINKAKSITIRVNESDLRKIKAKALALGIPYQTLIGSALHQYAKKESLEV